MASIGLLQYLAQTAAENVWDKWRTHYFSLSKPALSSFSPTRIPHDDVLFAGVSEFGDSVEITASTVKYNGRMWNC